MSRPRENSPLVESCALQLRVRGRMEMRRVEDANILLGTKPTGTHKLSFFFKIHSTVKPVLRYLKLSSFFPTR